MKRVSYDDVLKAWHRWHAAADKGYPERTRTPGDMERHDRYIRRLRDRHGRLVRAYRDQQRVAGAVQ